MAKCTLMPGIESISGSIKVENGSRIIFKTFTKPSANRKGKTETRMYLSQKHERTTPLSKAEIAARRRFYMVSQRIKNLTDEERQRYREDFVRSKFTFNGKRYATLRGWLVARFSAEYKK